MILASDQVGQSQGRDTIPDSAEPHVCRSDRHPGEVVHHRAGQECGYCAVLALADDGEPAAVAEEVVWRVMRENAATHGETWRDRADGEDIAHAIDHLEDALRSVRLGCCESVLREDIEHALTRCALVRARNGRKP